MEKAGCCERGEGRLYLCRPDDSDETNWWFDCGSSGIAIAYCPFCGKRLSAGSMQDAISLLLNYQGPARRITFDVDGVLCDDRDQSVLYADRKPYPGVPEFIRTLKGVGFTIVMATARYMNRFDGDKQKASEYGRLELAWWLKENDIPFDELHFGKPSTDTFYVDDKAFRLRSNDGETGWRDLAERLVSGGIK